MTEFVVREGENGRAMTVGIGDSVKIELPENPTTGFRWQVASVDAGVLRPQSDDFVASSAAAVGGGGLRTLHWAAASTGTTEIRLHLKRAWEALPPHATFTVRIAVI